MADEIDRVLERAAAHAAEFPHGLPDRPVHAAWVHVDGAFGLWAAASPRLRGLLEGVERADSWATDAHKWLNVPYDSGLAVCAHPEAHHAAMRSVASYLIPAEGARDGAAV